MRKLSFAVGLAAGYVLGSKAGRERYHQIADAARNLADQPVVAKAQSKIMDTLGNGHVVDEPVAPIKPVSAKSGSVGTQPTRPPASADSVTSADSVPPVDELTEPAGLTGPVGQATGDLTGDQTGPAASKADQTKAKAKHGGNQVAGSASNSDEAAEDPLRS